MICQEISGKIYLLPNVSCLHLLLVADVIYAWLHDVRYSSSCTLKIYQNCFHMERCNHILIFFIIFIFFPKKRWPYSESKPSSVANPIRIINLMCVSECLYAETADIGPDKNGREICRHNTEVHPLSIVELNRFVWFFNQINNKRNSYTALRQVL